MFKDLVNFALDLLKMLGLLGAVVGTFFWAMFQVVFMF